MSEQPEGQHEHEEVREQEAANNQANENEHEENHENHENPQQENDNENEEVKIQKQREHAFLERVKILENAYKLYVEEHSFKPGDLVTWKSSLLKNHSFLGDDRCGIVTQVLDDPVYDNAQTDAGSQCFREPLDIVIGAIDTDDGEFFEIYLDSRRLMPYDPKKCGAEGKEKEELIRLCSELLERYTLFTAPRERELRTGDAVRWKKGLSNKKRPKADEPAVVVETLYEQRKSFDPTLNSNTQYFREPLDIKIAFVDKDGEFMIYHYDSRRFELVDDEDLQKYSQQLCKRRPKPSSFEKPGSSSSLFTSSDSNNDDDDDDDDDSSDSD